MSHNFPSIFIGDTVQKRMEQPVKGEYVPMLGEIFYKIQNYDAMPPFFMSIVSSSNHWLFISSTGGLSAGRVSAEQALFPYYTDDKLTENSESTGNKAIFLVSRATRRSLWEPFSQRQQGIYQVERNIYKNIAGTVLVFEENNHSLGLAYRYAWRTSDAFGFVKTSWVHNFEQTDCQVELLDGMQNILPANISSQTQNTFSPLLDAYKRGEADPETGLAIFALNSTLTDLAEPSESLLATTVFQLGLDQAEPLLSALQLDQFRAGLGVVGDTQIRGQRCAYFVHTTLDLTAGAERSWHLVAEVSQDSAAVIRLSKLLTNPSHLLDRIEQDIAANNSNLEKIVASTDGLQVTKHPLHCAHHYANVMFNGMRGGIFADQYQVHTQDFIEFISARNRPLLQDHALFFSALPPQIELSALQARAEASGAEELIRLSCAYLPLSFSRRHGDPSRPWNRFAINIKKEDGSRQLDYEGNWRDIFQNWEALAYSYPEYVESMISTFLNATTVDGYNPYRITRQGLDWELPEPHNPWANIGYWSDHQIIYLQKLMEISVRVHPGRLQAFLARPLFSYANVPYRIKPYADLQRDPYNSIDFDWELQRKIETRVKELGTDGKLVADSSGGVLRASLVEKLLTLLLAKLTNFVPEGGIWMNTQRPEWNDANNALVGKGLSVVTLCYLRRYIVFFKDLLNQGVPDAPDAPDGVQISADVQQIYAQIAQILLLHQGALTGAFSDTQRRAVMDALGQAGSDFRRGYYANGLSGEYTRLPAAELAAFLDLSLRYVEHSLRANRRGDALFHAYNILRLDRETASIGHLSEMLEGQVAVLSSGLLSGAESLALLESLRRSPLYRPDQNSYILYPDRPVQDFLAKNRMTPDQVRDLALVAELVKAQDTSLISVDVDGAYHFNGQIRNLKDVNRILDALGRQPRYGELVKTEGARIKSLFEAVFHHDEFTGRSGTFFAYEGLGSIYWHMMSKLLLAVQETILRTSGEPSTQGLIEKYAEMRKGQCFNKPPDVYGAFPTDPYSHTPKGQGAKQPGMTGMVKEEFLTRQVELGMSIENGRLAFNFLLLDRDEFLAVPAVFSYWRVDGQQEQLELQAGSLVYSICQVPVILQASNEMSIQVFLSDGSGQKIDGHVLDAVNSRHIFERDGKVHHLIVSAP